MEKQAVKRNADGNSLASMKEKLAMLNKKRIEANRLNRAEVVEEDRVKKMPKNWENRQERAEWKLNDIKKRKECEEKGLDYNRQKLLSVSASDADKMESAKRAKKNFDPGFSTFDEAGTRHYQKLVKKIKPDMQRYEEKKAEMGEEIFYAGINTPLPGHIKDSPADIKRMVDDLVDRKEKKRFFSRRRFHNDNKDVDYINEGNAKHNQKLEKYYGKYTTEIKQNLERGTAV